MGVWVVSGTAIALTTKIQDFYHPEGAAEQVAAVDNRVLGA